MASLVAVSEAVIERISPVLPDWETLWYTPWSPPLPSLCLRPDETKFAGFEENLGSYTKWYLRAGLTVQFEDEEAAYRDLGELVDPSGPLITRFLDEDLRDTLYDLCGLNLEVVDGRRWKTSRRRRLSCDIGLVLGAN